MRRRRFPGTAVQGAEIEDHSATPFIRDPATRDIAPAHEAQGKTSAPAFDSESRGLRGYPLHPRIPRQTNRGFTLGPIFFMTGSDVARDCSIPKVLNPIPSALGFQSTRLRSRWEANHVGSSHKGNDGIGGVAVISTAHELCLHGDLRWDRFDFGLFRADMKQRLMNIARDCFT